MNSVAFLATGLSSTSHRSPTSCFERNLTRRSTRTRRKAARRLASTLGRANQTPRTRQAGGPFHMSNVGAVATNLHEGSRSEYLAQYVFASFGTATPVPHQEDAGVDLYCTMTEQVGRLSWPRYYYTVQVKSTMDPWRFGSADSVRWLVEHPFPLFLCVLDKSAARLRLYHTFPRFLLWVTGTIPNSLELVPDEGREGHSTQWENGTTFSLGAPILDRTILELLDDTTFTQARAGVESWLQLEARNLVRVAMRVPIFSMPYAYETNATTFGGGTVFQSSTLPERFDSVRDTLGDVLPW